MLNINAIVCMDKKGGIGKNNKLPWKFKNDMKHFKKTTIGIGNNAIVFGKNTWNSVGFLSNRDNFILSSKLNIDETKNNQIIKTFENIQLLLNYLKMKNYDEIWIIGGSKIYKKFLELNLLNHIIITQINNIYDCDVFFPKITNNFFIINEQILQKNEFDTKPFSKIIILRKLMVGMYVYYKNDKNKLWKVINVHCDDYPNYYFTIQDENKREIQTIHKKLTIYNYEN